jgi:heme exporter protein CcmD
VGYVIAAYGIVLAALAGYALHLVRARRQLRKSPSEERS